MVNKDIHYSAIVDPGASIGDDTKIWHFSHISSGAKIGTKCVLGQNVFVSGKAIIGNNCKIQNNVSIYDNVTLASDVFCGPSMVFTNVYNPRASIDRKSEFLNTTVHSGVTFGANCTIICGVVIGKYAFIGAGAVVNTNIAPYALVVGVPAQQIGWISEYGERLNIPLKGHDISDKCAHTGTLYTLVHDSLTKGI